MRSFLTMLLTIIVFSALATTSPELLAAEPGVVVHEGTFAASDLTWANQTDGTVRPGLPGLRAANLPGQLDLPAAELLLLVPADRTVLAVVIEPLASHREARPGLLSRTELATSNGLTANDPGAAPHDPNAWGELTGTHFWRGHQLATVRVRPLRPAADDSGELEFLDAYAVRLIYGDDRPDRDIAVRRRLVDGETERNRSLLSAVIANPAELHGYVRDEGLPTAPAEAALIPTALPSLSGRPVAYLVITSEAMAAEFAPLVLQRERQGLPSAVVTIEHILANYRHGADLPETLRLFIRDAYELWGTEYVLLGGDADVLPPRYINNTLYPPGGSTDIPADIYFAGLDGNWNADGDHLYGEPASSGADDLADFLGEVYLGRAPVNDPAEATVFVDKVIAYEWATRDAGWANRALLAAEVLFPEDWPIDPVIDMDGSDFARQLDEELFQPCTDMEVVRMYQTFETNPGDALLTRQAFIDSLNSGHYGLINHIGHGYYYNASVGDANYDVGDADALTNGTDRPFVFFALNCSSAGFHFDSLMEHLLRNPAGGAVATVGSTEAAFPVTTSHYQYEFFNQLLCQSVPRAGELLHLSRLPWVGMTTNNYTDRWTHLVYTLLGDPALMIWTSSPRPIAVQKPLQLVTGPQTVDVDVTDAGGPVVGADVAMVMGGGGFDYVHEVTDATGLAALSFRPDHPGLAELSVTGRNLERFDTAVPVFAPDAYLAVDDATVVDDGTLGSQGNGDGRPDGGELVALVTTLQETGGVAGSTLTGMLTTSTPGVLVLSGGPVTFPDVAAWGWTTADAPYLLAIDPGSRDGTPLAVDVTVTCDQGVYTSSWTSTILAPEPEVTAVDWEDATYGDGDGLLEDGERIAVTCRLKNFGAGLASGLVATLRTGDPNVTLVDTVTTVPDLPLMADDEGDLPFSLALADASLASESTIVVTDGAGRTLSHTFHLQRPLSPGTVTADPSLGADLIALTWEPSPDPAVVGYHVQRSDHAAGPFVQVNRDAVLGTSYFLDTGLEQLTGYHYRVVALSDGYVASAPTPVVSQTTWPAELPLFPLDFTAATSSHLAVGDVDGRGGDEIVLGADEVYVWHADGKELRDGDSYSESRGPLTDLGTSFGPSGVVLGELNGAAGLEMILCENGNGNYLVHAFDAFGDDLPGWPKSTGGEPGPDWNWSTAAVGDIDGDRDNEVIVHTLNGRLWAWHHDGSEVRDGDGDPGTDGVFLYRAGADYEYSMSGPALCDLDGDGARDIIFGTRYDPSGQQRLLALKYDGSDVPGFPVVVDGSVLCHPAVGDLDGDGAVEIVFNTLAGTIYAVRQDGTAYPGFPVAPAGIGFNVNYTSSPALGNMDADEDLEIVFVANTAGDLAHIVVLDTDVPGGTSGDLLSGYPLALPGSSEASPVLGDLDGDGAVDILHGIGGGSTTAPNNLYAYAADGTPLAGFPITLSDPIAAAPVITDLDWDGDVDIVAGSWGRELHVWDLPADYDRRLCPWPTFQGDFQRTGVFFPLDLVAVGDPGLVPPAGFTVRLPHPNPFNPVTKVEIYQPRDGDLRLEIYDLRGRRVRVAHAGPLPRGWHTLQWDGRDDGGQGQASGLYFLRATSAADVVVRKMTLLK